MDGMIEAMAEMMAIEDLEVAGVVVFLTTKEVGHRQEVMVVMDSHN